MQVEEEEEKRKTKAYEPFTNSLVDTNKKKKNEQEKTYNIFFQIAVEMERPGSKHVQKYSGGMNKALHTWNFLGHHATLHYHCSPLR